VAHRAGSEPDQKQILGAQVLILYCKTYKWVLSRNLVLKDKCGVWASRGGRAAGAGASS